MPCFSSSQRLYREKGESMKHNYTLSGELPEMVQAKLNAMNISEVKPHVKFIKQPINQSLQSTASVCDVYHVELSLYIYAFSELLQGILD